MTYRYFTLDEFACKETGDNAIDPLFVAKLDVCRHLAGVPFVINSGYRSPQHSVEAVKDKPGAHTRGRAADIRASDSRTRWYIIDAAVKVGFNRIGIAKDFIHLDMDTEGDPEVVWLY